MYKLLLFCLVISCGCFFVIGCSPSAKIAETSKTPECAAEITDALKAFSKEKGLAYNVIKTDADSLFADGTLEKSYGRDGSDITCHFALENTEQGCNLKLYKRTTTTPGSGQTRSTSTNYGLVLLSKCQCK